MEATFRLFPWDIEGDPDAAARLRADGVERVALAAVYHGARLVTPRHPTHRIVELPASASYLRDPAPLPGGGFSFEVAREALDRAGLRVDTWAVIGHLDGAVADEVPRVVNAYGDRLSHAPCLSQAPTRELFGALVRAAARAASGGTLHLEALGWQGLGHGSLHDKLHGADLDPATSDLLATCVCAACAARVGVDPRDLAAAVREAIDGLASGEPGSDASGPELLAAVAAARRSVAGEVVDDVLAIAIESGAAAVSVDADLLRDVSSSGRHGARGGGVERLVDCWGDVERGVAALQRAGGGTAYVDVLAGEPAGFEAHWSRLAAAGADRVHVYHAGLASTRRLRAAVAAAASLR